MVLPSNNLLAIILPVYNEENALELNFETIKDQLLSDDIAALYMFVDDGSTDNTWQIIDKLSKKYSYVSGIKFARNFGKEMALSAGLDYIDADYYLLMDSDLQHPPSYVKTMLQTMIENGADIVDGVKSLRGQESLKYKFVAKTFYRILQRFTQLEMANSSDFKLITREVTNVIRSFGERNVFFRGIVHWVGFKSIEMPFEVEERQFGHSNFSTYSLIKLALNAILSYTSSPLYLTLLFSIIFILFSLVLGVQTLYNYLNGMAVSGFSTVILLLLVTGSMLMMSLGIIGIYISRIYNEVKQRPRYIINKSTKTSKVS